MKGYKWMIVRAAVMTLIFAGSLTAEMTVEDAHIINKNKFKIRGAVMYIQSQKCYSDEVWKAFRDSSPYSSDYDKMISIPDGWHVKTVKIATGFEYGVAKDLNVGIFLPYVIKDVRKQVWSKSANATVWKDIDDKGLEDFWLIAKYRIYSQSKGFLGLNWKSGLLFAAALKPSISSDEKIKNGIGTGANEFKLLLLSKPCISRKAFLFAKIWYQYSGKVKEIENFPKSGWDLGDKLGYRFFLGYKMLNSRLVIVGGPIGWIKWDDRDKNGNKIEDSNAYSHNIVLKIVSHPFKTRRFVVKGGVKIPYTDKIPFAPGFVPFFYTAYLL